MSPTNLPTFVVTHPIKDVLSSLYQILHVYKHTLTRPINKKAKASLTLPSSSSWRVSTPYLGSLSPEKELACRSGFLTPCICDIDTSLIPVVATTLPISEVVVVVVEGKAATTEASGTTADEGPLDKLRSFLLGRSPSSTLRLGMSSSCCWSEEQKGWGQ